MEKEYICEYINKIQENPYSAKRYWIRKPVLKKYISDKKNNNFLFFLKPESISIKNKVNLHLVLDLVFSHLNLWKIDIGAIRLIPCSFLKKENTLSKIDSHFGILNNISRFGISACKQNIKNEIYNLFSSTNTNNNNSQLPVFGGHQFIKHYTNFTPYSLCIINDNIGAIKLAAGTYALKLNLFSKECVILNAFTPFQIQHLYSPGESILVFECNTTLSFNEIREKFIGYINPQEAYKKSLRYKFYKDKSNLGILNVSKAFNCVHVSPGPIEAIFQINRFFEDKNHSGINKIEDTHLGNLLLKHGFDINFLLAIKENEQHNINGKQISVLDYTENINTEESIKILEKINNKK